MSAPDTQRIRAIIQVLCPKTTDQVATVQLFRVFGLDNKNDKRRLRSKLTHMIARGELRRVEPGVFTYHPNAVSKEAAQGHSRIWRAIRSSRPGWKLDDIAQITRMTYSHVRKYCRWLAQEGYIARHGREGNTYLWRATAKAGNQRQAPIPGRAPADPFSVERKAACRLVRALMEADPGRPRSQKMIADQCQIILSRFAPAEEATK